MDKVNEHLKKHILSVVTSTSDIEVAVSSVRELGNNKYTVKYSFTIDNVKPGTGELLINTEAYPELSHELKNFNLTK